MKKISLLFALSAVVLAGCAVKSPDGSLSSNGGQGTGSDKCPQGLLWNEKTNSCAPDFSFMIRQQIAQQGKNAFTVEAGNEKKKFENKEISFTYQDAKEKSPFVEKTEPVKGIYNPERSRPVVEFGNFDLPGMKMEDFLKMRYMMGVDMEDQKGCTFTQKELTGDIIEMTIVPSDELLKKYASDPGMSQRLCGDYSVVNNMVFMYKKASPTTFVIVEKGFRPIVDTSSIVLK